MTDSAWNAEAGVVVAVRVSIVRSFLPLDAAWPYEKSIPHYPETWIELKIIVSQGVRS